MAQEQTASTTAVTDGSKHVTLAFTTKNTTAGDTYILVVNDDYGVAGQVSTITDTEGNIWQQFPGSATSENSFSDSEIWYAYNVIGGTKPTLTITFLHTLNCALVLAEYSGLLTSNPADIASSASQTTSPHSSGNTAALYQNNELIIGGCGWNGGTSTVTQTNTGFGNLVQVKNATSGCSAGICDKVVNAKTAQALSWVCSVSGHGNSICATFKIATAIIPASVNNKNNFAEFGAPGDYIQIGGYSPVPAFSVPTTGELTVCFWMNPSVLDFSVTEISNPTSEGNYVNFLGKCDSPNMAEYLFRIYNKTGSTRPNRISFYIFDISSGIGVGSYVQENVNINEWIFIAGKIDATSTYIYKNGVLKDTDVYNGSITPAAGNAPLRFATTNNVSYFQGKIDDVRTYNRALSDQEITNIYNSGMGGGGQSANMTHRYKFDELSPAIAYDEIGGLNGTLYGKTNKFKFNKVMGII